MRPYLDLLGRILDEGVEKGDRTGTGTKSLFGAQMRFDLADGFPLVTTKKLHLKSIIHELLWFLRGDTNIGYLNDHGVSIWDEWADERGDLGPVYGKQWRSWEAPDGSTIDQIAWVLDEIRREPQFAAPRRHRLEPGRPRRAWRSHPAIASSSSTWRTARLSCQLYQRSADFFLGVPFNIASYALLTHMIAHVTGLEAGEFVHTLGDAHLYLNHLEQAREQLARKPKPLPQLKLNPDVRSLFEFRYEDIAIENYAAHPAIKAPIAV